MNDARVREQILSFIKSGAMSGQPEVLDLYGTLIVERGKNCGDHFLTLIRFVSRGADAKEADMAVSVLLRAHPPLKTKRAKTGATMGLCLAIGGAGGATFMLSDPIVKVFGSVGIIGAVLLAVIILFKEPLTKAAFSQLNDKQTAIIFHKIIWIIGFVVIVAILGGVAVAIIDAVRQSPK